MTIAQFNEHGYTALQIETKAACNMRCKFCAYPLRQNMDAIMPSEKVAQILDEIDPQTDRIDYISFAHFNEPLLDTRLFEFFELARAKSLPLSITTNALATSNASIRRKLLDARLNSIKISLHTLDADRFAHLRGLNMHGSRYFSILYTLFSEALDVGQQLVVDIACNFQSRTGRLIKSLAGLECGDPNVPDSVNEFAQDLISFLDGLARHDARFQLDQEQVWQYLRQTNAEYRQQDSLELAPGIVLKIKRFLYGKRLAEYTPTQTPFSCRHKILGILADGSVVPCCHMYAPMVCLGNIHQDSLGEILEKSRFLLSRLRDTNMEKPMVCRRCFGLPTRRGTLLHHIARQTRRIWAAAR